MTLAFRSVRTSKLRSKYFPVWTSQLVNKSMVCAECKSWSGLMICVTVAYIFVLNQYIGGRYGPNLQYKIPDHC